MVVSTYTLGFIACPALLLHSAFSIPWPPKRIRKESAGWAWLDGFLFSESHLAPARLHQHAVKVRRERGHSLSHAYSHVATGPKIVRRHTLEQITGTAYQVLQLPVVGHVTEREVR